MRKTVLPILFSFPSPLLPCRSLSIPSPFFLFVLVPITVTVTGVNVTNLFDLYVCV